MLAFVFRRGFHALFVVGAIIVLNFLIVRLAPGDPAIILAGEYGTSPEYLAEIRARFGLDRPLYEQLFTYVRNVVTGDLGYSYYYRQPVTELIAERLWPSALLMGVSLGAATVIGILLGTLAALRPRSLLDNLVSVVALTGYALPVFFLGQLLLLLFAIKLDLLPVQGMRTLRGAPEGFGAWLDVGKHLLLPSLALGTRFVAIDYRLMRTAMMEVMTFDYINVARAKGLAQLQIVWRHALRNALVPVVTMTGVNIGLLLSGAVLVEVVFGWPGIGRLMYDAIRQRDYPVLMGAFIVVSIMVTIGNLLADIVHAMLDARVGLK